MQILESQIHRRLVAMMCIRCHTITILTLSDMYSGPSLVGAQIRAMISWLQIISLLRSNESLASRLMHALHSLSLALIFSRFFLVVPFWFSGYTTYIELEGSHDVHAFTYSD